MEALSEDVEWLWWEMGYDWPDAHKTTANKVTFRDIKLRILAEFTELQNKVREESQRESSFLILQTVYLLNFSPSGMIHK